MSLGSWLHMAKCHLYVLSAITIWKGQISAFPSWFGVTTDPFWSLLTSPKNFSKLVFNFVLPVEQCQDRWAVLELALERRGQRSKCCPPPIARSQLPESHTAAAAATPVTTGTSSSIFAAIQTIECFSLAFNRSCVLPLTAAYWAASCPRPWARRRCSTTVAAAVATKACSETAARTRGARPPPRTPTASTAQSPPPPGGAPRAARRTGTTQVTVKHLTLIWPFF